MFKSGLVLIIPHDEDNSEITLGYNESMTSYFGVLFGSYHLRLFFNLRPIKLGEQLF